MAHDSPTAPTGDSEWTLYNRRSRRRIDVHFLYFISPAKQRWAVIAIITGIVIAFAAIIIGLLQGSGDDARARGWFEWLGLLALGLIFGVPLILWLSARPSPPERDAASSAGPEQNT